MRPNLDFATMDNSLIRAGNKLGTLSQTLGATLTMDADMPQVLCLDCGGSGRTVLLPPEAKGLYYWIINLSDAAETLTVKEDSGSTTIGSVEQGAVGFFICSPNAAGGAATPTWFDLTVAASEAFYTGITAGTAAASKALVLGASKEIATITSATITTLTSTTVNATTVAATGKVSSSSVSAGVGYATGAGGTATQASNRTTTAVMSPAGCMSGTITTNNASLGAELSAEFSVTNTSVEIGDVIILNQRSGSNGGNTACYVSTVAAGSFKITVANNNAAGGTAETGAIIINFAVIKAVSA